MACGYLSDPGIVGKRSGKILPRWEYDEGSFVAMAFHQHITALYANASRRNAGEARRKKKKKSSGEPRRTPPKTETEPPPNVPPKEEPENPETVELEKVVESPRQKATIGAPKQEEQSERTLLDLFKAGAGHKPAAELTQAIPTPLPALTSTPALPEGYCGSGVDAARIVLVRELLSRMVKNLSLASVFSYLQEQQGPAALQASTVVDPVQAQPVPNRVAATAPPPSDQHSNDVSRANATTRNHRIEEDNQSNSYRRKREWKHDRRGRGKSKTWHRWHRGHGFHEEDQNIRGGDGRRGRRGHSN